MSYIPKAIFIIENGKYKQITHQELRERCESDRLYAKRRFVQISGMIMELSEEDYIAFYQNKRHEKYNQERDHKAHVLSYDALTTSEFSGEEIAIDQSEAVPDIVMKHLLIEKLHQCLSLLTEDEYELIYQYFYQNLSQNEIANKYCINQSTISRRISDILCKLEKMMKN